MRILHIKKNTKQNTLLKLHLDKMFCDKTNPHQLQIGRRKETIRKEYSTTMKIKPSKYSKCYSAFY